jgi:hypothetical protein
MSGWLAYTRLRHWWSIFYLQLIGSFLDVLLQGVLFCQASQSPPMIQAENWLFTVVRQLLFLVPQRRSRYSSAGAWTSNHDYIENHPFLVGYLRFIWKQLLDHGVVVQQHGTFLS